MSVAFIKDKKIKVNEIYIFEKLIQKLIYNFESNWFLDKKIKHLFYKKINKKENVTLNEE